VEVGEVVQCILLSFVEVDLIYQQIFVYRIALQGSQDHQDLIID